MILPRQNYLVRLSVFPLGESRTAFLGNPIVILQFYRLCKNIFCKCWKGEEKQKQINIHRVKQKGIYRQHDNYIKTLIPLIISNT